MNTKPPKPKNTSIAVFGAHNSYPAQAAPRGGKVRVCAGLKLLLWFFCEFFWLAWGFVLPSPSLSQRNSNAAPPLPPPFFSPTFLNTSSSLSSPPPPSIRRIDIPLLGMWMFFSLYCWGLRCEVMRWGLEGLMGEKGKEWMDIYGPNS